MKIFFKKSNEIIFIKINRIKKIYLNISGHYPFQYDHVKHEEYGNEWSSAPSYYSRSDKNNYSPNLFYQEPYFIYNIENIIYSLINMSNEDCQKRILCQIKKLTTSSTDLR